MCTNALQPSHGIICEGVTERTSSAIEAGIEDAQPRWKTTQTRSHIWKNVQLYI